MRKNLSLVLALTVMLTLLGSLAVADALAADKLITAKITDTATKLDRNGNEYVRLIIEESRSLQGVAYDADVPVMVFASGGSDLIEKAKALKPGDTLRAICDGRQYQGRVSYTLRAFVN